MTINDLINWPFAAVLCVALITYTVRWGIKHCNDGQTDQISMVWKCQENLRGRVAELEKKDGK